MIRSCFQVIKTESGLTSSKAFANKLSTNVSRDIRCGTVRNEPIIEEDICNVRDCCLGCWDSLSQFGILVGNGKYVLDIFCVLFWEKVLQYPLRQRRVVHMLGRAAVYAECGTCSRDLRSWGMCLRCGRRLGPCGASKSCNVVCCICVFDLVGQQSVVM